MIVLNGDPGCSMPMYIEEWTQLGKLDHLRHEILYSFKPQTTGSYEIVCSSSNRLNLYMYDEKKKKCCINMYNENAKESHLASTLIGDRTYSIKICLPEHGDSTNYKLSVSKVKEPNVHYLNRQWGIINKKNGLDINILPVWKHTKGKAFKIVIADSGIFYRHTELKSKVNLELSYNFVHNIKEVFPQNEVYSKASAKSGHGTHVAGVIVSQKEMLGVAPMSNIVSLKVLGNTMNNVDTFNDASDAFIEAIEYAKKKEIKIINCSFCGKTPSIKEKEAMQNAKDILFVLAAGNNSLNLEKEPRFPACYYLDNSIVVASLNKDGELEKSSNFGGPTDIAAPGSEILTTGYGKKYRFRSGTSIAAPFVSAVCSILLSENNNLSPIEVKRRVTEKRNVTQLDTLKGRVLSGGLLNAYKSILYPAGMDEIVNAFPMKS